MVGVCGCGGELGGGAPEEEGCEGWFADGVGIVRGGKAL